MYVICEDGVLVIEECAFCVVRGARGVVGSCSERWRLAQHLLNGGHTQDNETAVAERVLRDIASLKKRFGRRLAAEEPSRASISRHRRYSLGVEARRVLKGWIDTHMDDPYPSMNEKTELAAAARLSMKQVNDWFTNYRKRHWEDEMKQAYRAGFP